MNTALATRPAKGSVVQFRPNQNIERHMQVLHKSKQELETINKNIRKFLGLELGWGHTIFGRMFGKLVPKRFYGVMPATILKWVAEEADVLEQIVVDGLLVGQLNQISDVGAGTEYLGKSAS